MTSVHQRLFPITNNANVSNEEDAPGMREMIRAGGTFPKAIPGAFSHPPESLDLFKIRFRFPALVNSRRKTLPMPAFGATRDEGAVGPVAALSPYAEAARFRCYKPLTKGSKLCKVRTQILRPEPLLSPAKGPTAETILSTTASGRKPPVPEAAQEERLKKSLSKISRAIAAAASDRLEDRQPIDNRTENVIRSLPDKISGYHQTWGVAFSQEPATVHPSGSIETAIVQKNYPSRVIHPHVGIENSRNDVSGAN